MTTWGWFVVVKICRSCGILFSYILGSKGFKPLHSVSSNFIMRGVKEDVVGSAGLFSRVTLMAEES